MSNQERVLVPTFAKSIRGKSHDDSGKPMQDYSLAVRCEDFSIAVVCDGHGANKHFRSDIGSKLCAEVVKEQLIAFYDRNPSYEVLMQDFEAKAERLKLSIVSHWQARLKEYTDANPFTDDEWKCASPNLAFRKEYDIAQPYGTTLLTALVTRDYYLVLMLGDGAIVKINAKTMKGEIVTFEGKNMYEDQPHSATDSLCSEESFYTTFHTVKKLDSEEGAVAFGLCSDGFSEAFFTDEEVAHRLTNILNFYAEEGLEASAEPIENLMNEVSRRSIAKDDISIAFATMDLDAFIQPKAEAAPAEEAPAEEAPAEEAPAEEAPAEEAPAEEVSSEEAPAEEAPPSVQDDLSAPLDEDD